jgi:hypothetical protein
VSAPTNKRRFWTAQEWALVRDLYPHVATAKIAQQLGRTVLAIYQAADKLGLRKTAEFQQLLLAEEAARLRIAGVRFRYPKGHVPANKGLRRPGFGPGRMKETQFKKGQISKRWDPELYTIGALRINADGYIDMKVCEAPGALAWRALHVILWEDEHGTVPPGHALCFKDRDRLNVDLPNLELITRADLCRRNSIHNLPPEIKDAITALGALKRRVRREEQNRGLARSPFRHARRPARQKAAAGRRAG